VLPKEAQLMPEKILIVDDTRVNLAMLNSILKKEGFDTVQADNGETALERARSEHPDLVLLDVMMPIKDGYEVCTELKNGEDTSDLPVIFLSALGEAADKIRGLELGAADYITKPFDKGEVLARVRTQLRLQRLTRKLRKANDELVEKQERIDEDLRAAASIQRSLLPKRDFSETPIRAEWHFEPCEKIGGDILNIAQLSEHEWCVYILDVSGHGVPSALVTVSAAQSLTPDAGLIINDGAVTAPADVLRQLDVEYPTERFDRYFTMAYLTIDTRTGQMRYSTAAHPPPVLLREQGELETLSEGGSIIGMGGYIPFEEGSKQLRKGDRIYLFTDGIVEHQSPDESFYGEERFHALLAEHRNAELATVCYRVMQDLKKFGEGEPARDDISFLAIEYQGDTDDG